MNKKEKYKDMKDYKKESCTMDYNDMNPMMDASYNPNMNPYMMGMDYPMMEEDMMNPEMVMGSHMAMPHMMGMCMAPYMGMCPHMMYPMMEDNMMAPDMVMGSHMGMPHMMGMNYPMMMDDNMYDEHYLDYMNNMYNYMACLYKAETYKIEAMKHMNKMQEK